MLKQKISPKPYYWLLGVGCNPSDYYIHVFYNVRNRQYCTRITVVSRAGQWSAVLLESIMTKSKGKAAGMQMQWPVSQRLIFCQKSVVEKKPCSHNRYS